MVRYKNITILILAAGASRRMNGIKQILAFNENTLLGIAINEAKNVQAECVYCILGANAEKIESIISFDGVEKIYNDNWEQGIGSSISKGVEFITEKSPETDAILIVLADQPFVNAKYLNQLIVQYQQKATKIIATNYNNKAGVPAIFPKKYFEELSQLTGDNGAKLILKKMDNVELSTESVDTFDIDYPSDIPKN